MSKTMAEVLLAHWAHNCSPDKCTCSCGELIKHWGDGIDANEALAAHQEAMLTAAGFGLVADATRTLQLGALMAYDAVEESALRESGAKALEEAADALVWVRPDKSPCESFEGCCGSEASCDAMRPSTSVVGENWLRARAAAVRGEG